MRSGTESYWAVVLLGLAAMFILPLAVDRHTLTVLAIYGILALSLGLVWGYGGILCFGQGAFFGLGAYTYAIAAINFGESTFPLLLGIILPAAAAAVLGGMMFYGRLSDIYLAVITLVFTLIIHKLLNSAAGPEYAIGEAKIGGFNGIPGFQTLNVPGDPGAYVYGDSYYYFCFIALILVYLFLRWLTQSYFGRVSVAARQSELRVELMGYDVRARKTVLFAIGGAIAGLAGALFANWAEIVTPRLFSLGQSAEVIIWCIVGGVGTLIGPVLGAFALGLLKFLLGQQTLINNTAIMGLLLVLAVLFMPGGIAPKLGGLDRILHRKSPRNRHWRPRSVADAGDRDA